jgi:hypothetical protein
VTLAWLDPLGPPFGGLLGYLVLAAVCAGLASLAWREVAGREAPRGLAVMLIVAVALRLGTGIALARLLPIYGYTRQQAGYIFQDARLRDNDAWALGRSDQPLTRAFVRPQESDQYGGLLFLSAAIYRYLSAGVHRPLLVVVPAAAFGSLAVLFTWAFAATVIGKRAGAVAGWVVALYPDAVLLGASQMREPFIIAGLALALYGYSRARLGASRPGLVALLLGILIALFVSPPYALAILILVALAWLWEGGLRPTWAAAGLAGLAALALGLTALAWSAVQDVGGSNPLSLLVDWLMRGAQFQLSLLEQGSGWVQRLFELTPEWMHSLATLYGLTRRCCGRAGGPHRRVCCGRSWKSGAAWGGSPCCRSWPMPPRLPCARETGEGWRRTWLWPSGWRRRSLLFGPWATTGTIHATGRSSCRSWVPWPAGPGSMLAGSAATGCGERTSGWSG